MPLQPRFFAIALIAFALAGISATNNLAQAVPPAAQAPSLVPGQIETRASRVFIRVGKTGLGHEHGVEGHIKSGSVQLGATANAGQIVFDVTSFQADTPAARQYVGLEGTTDADTQRQVNANMLGPSVLDVQRYPTATLKVNSIQPVRVDRTDALPQYQIDGDFTLHGATRKVRILAEASSATGYTRLRGNFAILQTDYGITPYSKAFGAIGVADSLTIYGDLWIATSPGAK
ncbi:MAG TPA: YceI family protein [Pirellulales bacterium]|jgi:polyisoprenoid-binding protein YceI